MRQEEECNAYSLTLSERHVEARWRARSEEGERVAVLLVEGEGR